ncbi:MAG: sulfite exporter TauE/SafE family protein [Rhodospirillaceae bacterium]
MSMEDLLLFIVVGFAAQVIDGAVGMAYGMTATSVLLSFGVTPAVASSTVHAAEVFTTGASGYAHWRLGNVNKDVFWKLMLPGTVGGALGAYMLASVSAEFIQPIVALYLMVMGAVIVTKAFRPTPETVVQPRHTRKIGFAGALLDAIGGGGWGPLVTSSLIGWGMQPRYAIGTSNAAEFFDTTVISVTFLGTIGLELWPMIVGLIIGGVIAAPFGAILARQFPNRALMILVGVIIAILSLRNLVHYLG